MISSNNKPSKGNANYLAELARKVPFSRNQLLFASLVFGLMGLFSFSVIRGAGPGAVLEAEGGEKTGNIIVGSDPNASGGNQQYVQFGEVGVPPITPAPTSEPTATPSTNAVLVYSEQVDGSNPQPLEGATVYNDRASIFANVDPTNVVSVTFLLDGQTYRTEQTAPYTFENSPISSVYEAITELDVGQHTIAAQITRAGGASESHEATFTVDELLSPATSTPPAPTTTPSTGGGNGPQGERPTTANTGPRTSNLQTRGGGTISGSVSNVQINGSVTLSGATLTDCVINGGVTIAAPSKISHCDINGSIFWNTTWSSSTQSFFTADHIYVVGHGELFRPSTSTWGNTGPQWNVKITDSYFKGTGFPGPGDHYDLMQMGGGSGYVFERVAFEVAPNGGGVTSGDAAYVNADVGANTRISDFWVKGRRMHSIFYNHGSSPFVLERGYMEGQAAGAHLVAWRLCDPVKPIIRGVVSSNGVPYSGIGVGNPTCKG